MARLQTILPTDVIKDFNKIYNNTEEIFGGMTKAGAEVVEKNVKAKVPLSKMKSHVKLSRVYKTPSNGGINTKVYLSGYIPFSGDRTEFKRRGRSGGKVYSTTKGVPVEFLSVLYEYGRSTAPFPYKPFLRPAFRKAQIEKAMLKAQKDLSGGLLDE